MIQHIVLFTVREGIDKDDPRIATAIDGLRALEGKIGQIRRWEVGVNFSDRPIATDYALVSGFDSRDDLADYIAHPSHREIVALLEAVFTWVLCDYPA